MGNGLRPDIWEPFQERFGIPRIVEFYGATEGNVALANLDETTGAVGKRLPRGVAQPELIRYDVESDVLMRGSDGLCIPCDTDEVGELAAEIPASRDSPQGRFEGYTSREATEGKILHDVRKAYVPLTRERFAAVRSGELWL